MTGAQNRPVLSKEGFDVFVYRCSDGHLFKMTMLIRLFSVHLGITKFGRCPLDGKWRMLRWVREGELTERELESVHGRG